MRPAFLPETVNGPFDDPGLHIPLAFEKRSLLFDAGDLSALSPGKTARITHVFVSHTHMDHFIGLDRLVRMLLGREKELNVYGPEGFLENLSGKLGGYCWNLVKRDRMPFVVHGTELRRDKTISRSFFCRDGFSPSPETYSPFSPILLAEPTFTVEAAILDHGIDCLGFCLQETIHVNILKDRLLEMGLAVGPWLKDFKKLLAEKEDREKFYEVPSGTGTRFFRLGELADRVVKFTPGQKIAYITDTVWTPEQEEKMIGLCREADHLFIESAFLSEDEKTAREKYHLTAAQAGRIAGKAGVKRFTIFHFSPRYINRSILLVREAQAAYERYFTGR